MRTYNAHAASCSDYEYDYELKAILEPYTYLTESPGNDVRAKIIVAFNSWLNVPARELLVISSVVSTLHNASLL